LFPFPAAFSAFLAARGSNPRLFLSTIGLNNLFPKANFIQRKALFVSVSLIPACCSGWSDCPVISVCQCA
jgi:hypothetical protein